eukprot:Awhi_evm1s7652
MPVPPFKRSALMLYRLAKQWWLDPIPMKPMLNFQPYKLIKKETVVQGIKGRICPVRTFTFELPS